jgi:FMN phosphatase YigB (HAD superfamily)
MTPQAAVFDLGKVLVDFDYGLAARALAKRARIGANEVRALIDQSPLLFTYETGGMPTSEFYRRVCDATGFCGDLEEFGRLFADIFTPITPMIVLHGQVRRAGIPTYIFSNTNELAVAHIRRTFPFFSDFDGYIFSFEAGAMKPDEAIYVALEKRTGLSGRQILYIDDRFENVEAATKRGWQVIQHQDAGVTSAEVLRVFQLS